MDEIVGVDNNGVDAELEDAKLVIQPPGVVDSVFKTLDVVTSLPGPLLEDGATGPLRISSTFLTARSGMRIPIMRMFFSVMLSLTICSLFIS